MCVCALCVCVRECARVCMCESVCVYMCEDMDMCVWIGVFVRMCAYVFLLMCACVCVSVRDCERQFGVYMCHSIRLPLSLRYMYSLHVCERV